MFKKDITPGPKSKIKSSLQRSLRTQLLHLYPLLTPHIDTILPKKEQLDLVKLPEARCNLYVLNATPLFFTDPHDDKILLPHLRLVHQYPWAFKRVRIDRGGVRFVLSGATLMVPGLTSPGGRLPGHSGGGAEGDEESEMVYANEGKELEVGEIVVVDAEGKESACLVGVLKMGSKEMKEKKKGVAIEGGHYVGDGLWKLDLS